MFADDEFTLELGRAVLSAAELSAVMVALLASTGRAMADLKDVSLGALVTSLDRSPLADCPGFDLFHTAAKCAVKSRNALTHALPEGRHRLVRTGSTARETVVFDTVASVRVVTAQLDVARMYADVLLKRVA